MKNIKKIFVIAMAFLMGFSLFGGCKNGGDFCGDFLWLDQAYEQGWISRDDLRNISFNYNTKNYTGVVDYGADFSPTWTPLEPLSDKTKSAIKEAYCRKHEIPKYLYVEIAVLSEYYGVFSDCYIVDITTTCLVGGDPVYYEEYDIDGIMFYNYHYIGVYKAI